MSDNIKRSGKFFGKGIRFKQEFSADTSDSLPGISPLFMHFHNRDNFQSEEENYALPGLFYREMLSDEDRKNLECNIVCTLLNMNNPQKEEIVREQLYHFFRIDTKLGLAVADGLKIKVGAFLLSK